MGPIGSSDVAQILGLSPWGSVWETWSRLHGLTGYDSGGTPATRRGHMLESALLCRYAVETGRAVLPGPPLSSPGYQGPEPWMSARPDGYVPAPGSMEVAGASLLLEAKTAKELEESLGWGVPGTDEIPKNYLLQCVWQMAVCDVETVHLIAFGTMDDDYRVYVIHRDHELEGIVIGLCRSWYQRHIVQEELPAIDSSEACRQTLALRWAPTETRPDREASLEDLQELHELEGIRDSLDALEERRRALEARIQARMGPAGRLVSGDLQLARWGDRKGSQRFDLESLRRSDPELAAQWTRPGKPGRTFTLKRSKK